MANIQEDVTRQVWDLFLKFFGTGTEFVYQIAHEGNILLKEGGNFTKEFLVALINKQKENGEPTDITALMLKRHEKGESINTMYVAEEDAKELSEYFNKKGILYKVVENMSDDTKIFMYMGDDSQKVLDVVSLWQAEKGLISELSPDLFLDNFAKESIGTLSGLDNVDLEMFRQFAKENCLIFTVIRDEETDKHIIVYDPKDIETVRKTMDSTLWMFSGKDGAKIKEQLNVLLKNKQQVNRSLLEPEKEFYIVSGKSLDTYVHLTANDLTYYKNSKEVLSANRNSNDFIDRALRVFEGMDQPILLTREEYEILNEEGNFDKEAIKKTVDKKAKELPDVDELKNAQEKHNKKLALIQSKMALDDENTSGFWIYDEGVSFEDGYGYEDIEDIDEQLKEDVEDARTRAAEYKFARFDAADDRSIEHLISEAKKQRKQPETEEKHQEQEREDI